MRAPRAVDTEDQIAGVVKRVTASIDPAIPWDVVDAEVRRCFAEWTDVPVRDFIPIFAERAVRARFRRQRQAV